jgi:hypothetical protein
LNSFFCLFETIICVWKLLCCFTQMGPI